MVAIAVTVSEPSCKAGAWLPNIEMLCLEPAQSNSVLAGFICVVFKLVQCNLDLGNSIRLRSVPATSLYLLFMCCCLSSIFELDRWPVHNVLQLAPSLSDTLFLCLSSVLVLLFCSKDFVRAK